MGFSCTRAKVSAVTWRSAVGFGSKSSFSRPIRCLNFLSAGVFAIQLDKKSLAETKTAEHLGLIAGGTGKEPL